MIAIGCDHTGIHLKESVKKYLTSKGLEFKDFGALSSEKFDDYPIYARPVSEAVASGEAKFGILICGTGIGMMLCANKKSGVRAICSIDSYSVKFSRRHNDANVLCFGARVVSDGLAVELCDIFLNTEFEGGRHAKRVGLIEGVYEKK
ncbi:MAG: ribose 5-phosphate isomerase B [Oscillospiraceae bacterium]|nr:ribose 5-phosphate isomerase B [Oscillospiraceae bacterium]